MLIKFRRYDAKENKIVQHIITNVDHISVGNHRLFYWKVGQPKWMFTLDVLTVSDVRIENETKND